ncbi:hypothetical protein R50073_23460 [Maricurvus nonylphenolicus]
MPVHDHETAGLSALLYPFQGLDNQTVLDINRAKDYTLADYGATLVALLDHLFDRSVGTPAKKP